MIGGTGGGSGPRADAAAAASTVGYLVVGDDGLVRAANRPAAALVGVDADRLTGRPASTLVHPLDVTDLYELLEPSTGRRQTVRLRRADGSTVHVEAEGDVLPSPEGTLGVLRLHPLDPPSCAPFAAAELHAVLAPLLCGPPEITTAPDEPDRGATAGTDPSSSHDAPDRIDAFAEAIRAALARLGELLGVDRCAMVLDDPSGSGHRWVAGWSAQGTSHAEGAVSLLKDRGAGVACAAVQVDDAEEMADPLRARLRDRGLRAALVVPVRSRGHELGALLVGTTGGPRRWGPREHATLALVAEVAALGALAATACPRTAAALGRAARLDPLTGVANRALFLDQLDRELARRRRSSEELAVLFIDVDRFKHVNYTHGHQAGDRVLQAIADRLALHVRPSDLLARLGGDEFAVLLPDVGGVDAAVAIASRMHRALESPVALGGATVRPTVSIGIAMAGAAEQDADALLRRADEAMYRAKDRGRDRVELFDDELHRRVTRRRETEAGLRSGIGEGRFHVVFQPEWDLRSGRVVAAEALLRWRHPSGDRDASTFIDVAETTGLIHELTPAILDEACRWADRFRAVEPGFGSVRVNLSACELLAGGAAAMILDRIGGHGIAPDAICVEVAESVLARDAERLLEPLVRLRDAGVRVAIDEFGLGWSSIALLPVLRLDVLKIDRSFVARLDDERGETVVRAAIGLAQALVDDVVAEGIERQDQLDALRRLGCDRGQGTHLGAPVPGARLHDLLGAPVRG